MKTTARTTGRAPALRDSLEQVWLAGLGALTLTEDEGTTFFKSLVKRGEGLERQTLKRLDTAVADVTEAVRRTRRNAVVRIEDNAEEAMTKTLHRLGVPTRDDVQSLTRRVESLAEQLERQAPRRPSAPRTVKRARKPATA
jgi:poly(hydroxyalkanoate) granule-associated protein